MEQIFGNGFIGIITFLGMLILGAFQLLSTFDKAKKTKTDEADKLDERVIKLLKDQIEALEKKVSEQALYLESMKKRLDKIVDENKTLREILQGRDKATKEYQQAGLVAMKRGEEMYTMMMTLQKSMLQLNNAVTNHLVAVKQ